MALTVDPRTQELTTWSIDPSHTLVEFSAKHMMFTTVKGRFTGVQGTIRTIADNPARSEVDVQIDATSLATGDPNRDGHLLSPDFLDVERYPTINFRSTRVEPAGPGRLKVYGDLTIRDVTREVVLDAEVQGEGRTPFGTTVAGFSAQTQVNRKDWGLGWNVALETGGWLVGDTIKIALEVEAVKQQ